VDATLLRPLFRFNSSANEQLRAAALDGGEALLRRPLEQWYGSVYHLLVHLCRAERNWLLRLRDGAVPPANTGDDEFPQLAPLLQTWHEVDGEWERYVATLSPQALAATAVWSNPRGGREESALWRPVIQIPLHSAEHRGVAGAGLTQLGVRHGALDFMAQSPPIEL
jgi:uncharacterized damage-inducible protein DinB